MNKIKLLKEPGYIYDLNFIFCLKFNIDLYISDLPDDKKESAIKHFQEVMDHFSDIPDDLYIFFHAIKTGRTFLASCYFKPYCKQFSTTYDFKFLQKELSNKDKLIRNVISFYFNELDGETLEQCANSLNDICYYIKNSDYSNEEKTKLYEFFLNPTSYMQLLQYELMAKNYMLTEYYKDNYQRIIDIYNQTTYELLCEQMKSVQELRFVEEAEQVLYTSYCLLNTLCISFYILDDGCLSLLGCDYVERLVFVKDEGRELDLCSLGTALCEESRIKILKFLLKREEVTCKDLEKEFNFSGSTAYHHINIMTKSGLVKTRNKGKTIIYSLNEKYISNIIDVFNIFLKKKGK